MFNAFYVKKNMKKLIMKEKWHLDHFHLIGFALSSDRLAAEEFEGRQIQNGP